MGLPRSFYPMRLLRKIPLLILVSLAGGSPPALAHDPGLSALDVTAAGNQLQIELRIARRDIEMLRTVDADHDGAVSVSELQQVAAPLDRGIRALLEFSVDRHSCKLEAGRLAMQMPDTLHAWWSCPNEGRMAAQLAVPLLERLPRGHRMVVTVHDASGAAITTRILAADDAIVRWSISNSSRVSRLDAALAFIAHGLVHILTGYDHLAFLLLLLIPTVVVRVQGQWRVASSLRAAVRDIAATVTAFTAAHTITLALATFDLLRVSARPVEIAIAGSVLVAALINLWPLRPRKSWPLAFGFGLVHGLGFAGALRELGLGDSGAALKLAAFNVGVELGQLAVVAIALPMLFVIVRRDRYLRAVVPLSSLAMTAVAACWMLDRALSA